MKTRARQFWMTLFRPVWLAGILAGVVAAGTVIWAALPSQNPSGMILTQSAGEIWSGTGQTNPAGAHLEIAGAFDTSVDSQNTAGATAYLGHLGPAPSGLTAFANPQPLRVAAAAAESWRYYIYNYNTGDFKDEPANLGPATIDVGLTYNQWIGVFLYSYDTGKWEEGMWYLMVDW